LQIYIHAPLNETINMINVGCNGPFIVELNVSANFDVDSWWYTLEDLKYNQGIQDNLPNTTLTTSVANINIFRWQNRLTVFANESTGIIVNKSIVFYVNVSNHAPILGDISNQLYACEAANYNYGINASDCDEDSLTFGGSSNDPFFIFSPRTTENITSNLGMFGESNIFSLPLTKQNININYSLSASVTDGYLIDVKNVNVSVIEINNPPQYSVFIPGANTVWTKGENSTFIREFNATDVEDENQDSGNLSYNISFVGSNLFGITNKGKVSYVGNQSDLGNHFVSVCVADKGIPLAKRHSEIQTVCGQTGENQSNCVTFQLTVTDQNRPPTIISFYPKNLSFSSFSTDNLHFNITTFDPDGTIPDVFWYVNGQLTKYDNLTSISQFNYNFGCGVSGKQNIRVDITDGELNDSLQWNVTLIGIACPITPPGGGSGMPECS